MEWAIVVMHASTADKHISYHDMDICNRVQHPEAQHMLWVLVHTQTGPPPVWPASDSRKHNLEHPQY